MAFCAGTALRHSLQPQTLMTIKTDPDGHQNKPSCLQEKERLQQEEVEAAREEASAAAEAFTVVRRQRQDAFCAAFEHVSGVIDGIFKGEPACCC